jgi:hypothetical protein
MVALALNPLAAEFTSIGCPPGLLTAPAGPPGVHAVAIEGDELPPPPGLTAPPGLMGPPGLAAPPGLDASPTTPTKKESLADINERLEAETARLEAENALLKAKLSSRKPPGTFEAPSPKSSGPPGVFSPTGPPGVWSAGKTPPGVWSETTSDELSTDAESDGESSQEGSFSE